MCPREDSIAPDGAPPSSAGLESNDTNQRRDKTPSPDPPRSLDAQYRLIFNNVNTPKHKKRPVLKYPPIAYKLDCLRDSFLPNKSDGIARSHEAEGRKVLIGPMPVQEFLDKFLPPAPEPTPNFEGAFNDVPSDAKDEKDIYSPFVNSINDHQRCPSVRFCVTADTPEHKKAGRGALKPDFLGYSPSGLPFVEREVIRKRKGGSVEKLTKYEANLGLAELFGDGKADLDPICENHFHGHDSDLQNSRKETKKKKKGRHKSFFACDNHLDGNNQNPDNDSPDAKEERRNLGQSIAYANEIFLRQHRMFLFSFLLIGTRVRFFRWDRAGAIVTKSLDYKHFPKMLCEFLWRFHHANPVQRGFDPTVTIASTSEEELFRRLIREHIALQLNIDDNETAELDMHLKEHYEEGKVTKVEVYKRGGKKPNFYLVSVPQEVPLSAAGEGTRTYWAVKLMGDNEGVVHSLKDTWRVALPEAISEGEVYDDIGPINDIGNLEGDGDVPNFEQDSFFDSDGASESSSGLFGAQYTETDKFTDAVWVCECLKKDLTMLVFKRTHYRLVLRQAGYPLKRFTSSRELFGAAKGVLQALDFVHRTHRRIHCDVSLDNIILYRSHRSEPRKGLLINWASSTVESRLVPSTFFRTASWAFASERILTQNGRHLPTKEDDMESIFYVVMYSIVRWLPHDNVAGLGAFIFGFFHKREETKSVDGWEMGGATKLWHKNDAGRNFLRTFKFSNQYILLWLKAGFKYLAGADERTWTMESLRAVVDVAHEGLLRQEETSNDRTEHSVSDYYVAAKAKEASRGTHTSRSDNRDRETRRNADRSVPGDPIKRHREAEDVLQGPAACDDKTKTVLSEQPAPNATILFPTTVSG